MVGLPSKCKGVGLTVSIRKTSKISNKEPMGILEGEP